MSAFGLGGGPRSALERLAVAIAIAGILLLFVALLDSGDGDAPQDRPVNVGADDLSDISAHNSPTLVRNPRDEDNLVVTSRIDSPDFSCAVHVSRDGGESFARTRVPIPPGPGRKCFAPDAAFDADGTLQVSYVTLQGRGNRPAAVWVARSRDGGRSLSAPRRVAGPLGFQVRISADPDRAGRLYVSWLQAGDVGTLRFLQAGNPIVVSRSDDGGETWSRPVRVNPASRGRVLAPSTAVGPRGELYVLYLDVGEDRLDYEGGHGGTGGPPYGGRFTLVLARSLDRGATWEESVVDERVVPTRRFIAFLPPFPSLAVDRASGRVHVGFEDARLGTPDVWVWSLAPGASSWSGPVRVNDTPRRDGSWQYLPRLDVAPDGRLDVVYYDRRDSIVRNRSNDVSLQSSADGGRTFSSRVRLTEGSFDARIGAGQEQGLPDLGSRLALASDDGGAMAVWSDARSGNEASHKQDLRLADGSTAGGNRRDALLVAGIILVLAASGIAAAAVRKQRVVKSI